MTAAQLCDVRCSSDRSVEAGIERELSRMLSVLGDGMVRSVDAFMAVLNDSAALGDAASDGIATGGVDAAVRIERIAALERARAALAAAQLSEELAFARQQRTEQAASGVHERQLGRGIAEQIGFARRISPVSAARHLGLATMLATRLPEAAKRLRAGEVSEDQCAMLATRTSHLSDTDATIVDAGISSRMTGWNRRQTEQAVNRAA